MDSPRQRCQNQDMDNQAKRLPHVGRLSSLCRELVGLLGLRQGSVEIQSGDDVAEIHCHKGKPQQVHLTKTIDGLADGVKVVVHDKSLKFDQARKLDEGMESREPL